MMYNFFCESILVTSIMSWLAAQILKVILVLVHDKKLDISRFIGSGGMPSSHASFVTSLATGVGLCDGFTSNAFAISFVLALVVMYDAAGVRRAAGQQAKLLNQLIEEWQTNDTETRNKRLKELLGHTPAEVFAGAVLGVTIAIIRHI